MGRTDPSQIPSVHAARLQRALPQLSERSIARRHHEHLIYKGTQRGLHPFHNRPNEGVHSPTITDSATTPARRGKSHYTEDDGKPLNREQKPISQGFRSTATVHKKPYIKGNIPWNGYCTARRAFTWAWSAFLIWSLIVCDAVMWDR